MGLRRASGLRQMIRQYGSVAIGTYLTLSFTVFLSCVASIQILGIDQKDVYMAFNKIKNALGIETIPIDEQLENESQDSGKVISSLPAWMNNPTVVKVATVFLLASAITKLFTPIKLGVTVAIVPTVHKVLKRLGYIKK